MKDNREWVSDTDFWKSMDYKGQELATQYARMVNHVKEMGEMCQGTAWQSCLSAFLDEIESRQFELDDMCREARDLITEMTDLYYEKSREEERGKNNVE